MSRKTISLAICYVIYNPEKEGNNFVKLQKYIRSIADQDKTFIIVDNRNEGLKPLKLGENIYKIGGDNKFREFSGWQRAISTIRDLNVSADVILLANNLFLMPRGSYLRYYNAASLIKKTFEDNLIVGKIDRCRKKITVYGYDVSQWICTNCFFVPRRALERVPDLVYIKENINDFFESEFNNNHLILEQELTASDLKDGDFRIEAVVAGAGPQEVRLVLDRVDQTGQLNGGRPTAMQIKELALGDNGLDGAERVRGWRQDRRGNCWISGTGVAGFPPGEGKVLRLKGHIPPGVLEKRRHSRLHLKIFNDAVLFKEKAPLNRNFRLHLVEWLTERWHSRFEINSQTWVFFKNKVAAILNEALLSARFREAGFDISPFGKLDPLLRVFARFWKI